MIILRYLLLGYIIAIGLVIIGSWVPLEPDTGPYKVWVLCRRITDPVLEPVRRIVPPVGGMVDLSPTIVLFVLFALLRIL